ncbi:MULTISPECIES: DNA-binding protein [unclassified Stygiolobus]|jgi:DNA-binding TFAR19-related protein|uniref:DNA-binding protein n=1 Tax=unclassified Stygiolobus TaxID=2824672 RepID=UPI000D56D3AD|nr:DNA-binding protein [Sulfolobaceae archaeon]PVU75144.1 DNA-binding protein [Sulfolobus sp. SCGC AB-777_G06]
MSDEYDEELQELLRRKAVEQQRKVLEEQQRKAELEAKKEAILRVILTPEARQRLANVKLVKPEIAEAIENQLIALAQAGRIQAPLTDEELKEILAQLTSQTKKDFKITIKERGWK